jgi:hypothetical protein
VPNLVYNPNRAPAAVKFPLERGGFRTAPSESRLNAAARLPLSAILVRSVTTALS